MNEQVSKCVASWYKYSDFYDAFIAKIRDAKIEKEITKQQELLKIQQ